MWNQMSLCMTQLTKWCERPAKTQISLGTHPLWSESSLSTWRKIGSLATHTARIEATDQTGRCPGWSECSLGTRHFVGFVVLQLKSILFMDFYSSLNIEMKIADTKGMLQVFENFRDTVKKLHMAIISEPHIFFCPIKKYTILMTFIQAGTQ